MLKSVRVEMKNKILIVDDEPDVIEFLKKRLEASDFDVVSAGDGVEGLEKAREMKPDLILLDVIMPRKDGFKMLGELRSDETTCGIPVIMLTAKGEADSIFRGQELGAMDYIIKPFQFEELLKFIRKYSL